jgi:hypothetical protein
MRCEEVPSWWVHPLRSGLAQLNPDGAQPLPVTWRNDLGSEPDVGVIRLDNISPARKNSSVRDFTETRIQSRGSLLVFLLNESAGSDYCDARSPAAPAASANSTMWMFSPIPSVGEAASSLTEKSSHCSFSSHEKFCDFDVGRL